jgi:threonine dehydratase
MPEDAPVAKLEATRAYGAEVVQFDRYKSDREQLGRQLVEEKGMVLVPPFDDLLVMAGQGTSALELLDDVGPLDAFVAPMSGGGLMAGCATVVAARCPDAVLVGVEPEAGNDTQQSFVQGQRVEIDVPHTIADGLQMTTPGALTFPINRRLVREVVTVSDDELVTAMRFLFDRMKLVSEPSGAAGAAALLAGRVSGLVRGGARIGVILSGGNVGADRFAELVGRG